MLLSKSEPRKPASHKNRVQATNRRSSKPSVRLYPTAEDSRTEDRTAGSEWPDDELPSGQDIAFPKGVQVPYPNINSVRALPEHLLPRQGVLLPTAPAKRKSLEPRVLPETRLQGVGEGVVRSESAEQAIGTGSVGAEAVGETQPAVPGATVGTIGHAVSEGVPRRPVLGVEPLWLLDKTGDTRDALVCQPPRHPDLSPGGPPTDLQQGTMADSLSA